MIDYFLGSKYFFDIISGIGGLVLGIVLQRILNKRGLFQYFVTHSRVGISTNDAIFGSVQITWNGSAVPNLYLSTLELSNESLTDYENVVIRVFTNDTDLLTERTEIVDTTRILSWTAEFAQQMQITPGQPVSQPQLDLVRRQRDFLIPTMNRGQVVRFQFLNAAKTQNQPTIWLDVLHRGVKLQFHVQANQVFGVPQPMAALLGGVLGLIFVFLIVLFVHSLWLASLSSFLFGYLVIIPGAYVLKLLRWGRDLIGG